MEYRDLIMKRGFIGDEPAEKLLFDFDKYAKQITRVLEDPNTVTPFVIAVHGEWGSGKTSLMKAVGRILAEKKPEKLKVIEFDAWEYERMDTVTSLLLKMKNAYENTPERLVKSIGSIIIDAALRNIVGMSQETAVEHFEKFVVQTHTIREDIEKLAKNGRLIVLVDDLDRCNIENVLNMLEAIKMFLTAKGVIFVVAADMEKIERAWQLRYNSKEGLEEGRRHVDKIFQVKLSLPPKNTSQITEFVNEIVPDNLTDTERKFLIRGCPANPRMIKRVLNLEYFVLRGVLDRDEYKDDLKNHVFDGKDVIPLEEMMTLVMVWCILATAFAYVAKVVKNNPDSLLQMSATCASFNSLEKLNREWLKWIKDDHRGKLAGDLSVITAGFIGSDARGVLSQILEKKEYVIFELLQEIASHYDIEHQKEFSEVQPPKRGQEIRSLLIKIISYAGMTGV